MLLHVLTNIIICNMWYLIWNSFKDSNSTSVFSLTCRQKADNTSTWEYEQYFGSSDERILL